MKSTSKAFLVAAITAFSGVSAHAGAISEKAVEAERLLAKGDATAALEKLDEATEIAWTAAPLTVRKALFVDDSTGYGLYVERAKGPVFAPGEKIFVYIEPVGYGYGRTGVGSLSIGFDIDLVLADAKGETLISKDDFVSLGTPVRYKNREFYLDLSMNLRGLSAGDYNAAFTLRDQNSDKSTEFQMSFSIAE